MEESTNTQITKYITKEVKFILVVLSIAGSVAIPFWKVQSDVAVIKSNLVAHVQLQQEEQKNIDKQITDLKDKNKEQDQVSISLMSRMADFKNK